MISKYKKGMCCSLYVAQYILSGTCTLIRSFHISATREKYLILHLYSFTEHDNVHLKFPIKEVVIFMAGSICKQS